jgi:hypothetical protein
MASVTRRVLADFDNQHDFERLAADVLNALGYQGVEPMAPAGGSDGGTDIKFHDGDERGIALVTLDKNIRDKFKLDLGKHDVGEGVIALFCTVDVSPKTKMTFTQDALAKGYRLEVFDLERLRSLLDASLKEQRRRYLGIEDDVSAKIRSSVKKLLRFPDAFADSYSPKTVLESFFIDSTPSRLGDLLMEYDENEVAEVPGIGPKLHQHFVDFYAFRRESVRAQEKLLAHIGERSTCRIQREWIIQLKYNLLRFAGATKEELARGADFLNYGMTWESAERTFAAMEADSEMCALLTGIFARYQVFVDAVTALREAL